MGPLKGYRIVEFAGLGPAPMCAMLLADLGADVVRIDRARDRVDRLGRGDRTDLLSRSRRSIAIDLKKPEGRAVALGLIEKADALLEGFRPGVMERLGIGPDICLARNPRLIYGRMTGWGQTGPLAQAAGHDINYIAISGVLHAVGRLGEGPVPPINVAGDFGGGALYLALGVVCGLLEAKGSGRGQVIDAAMVDGAASLITFVYGMLAAGHWCDERGVNFIDGGAHFYDVYACADGKYICIGAIEPEFYAELLARVGLDEAETPGRMDRNNWPAYKAKFAALFRRRGRDEWCKILEGTDACFAPVLSLTEAPGHPHNKARANFVEVDGIVQPAPAPRFSRTPGAIRSPPVTPGQHTDAVLADFGFAADEIARLRAGGAVA